MQADAAMPVPVRSVPTPAAKPTSTPPLQSGTGGEDSRFAALIDAGDASGAQPTSDVPVQPAMLNAGAPAPLTMAVPPLSTPVRSPNSAVLAAALGAAPPMVESQNEVMRATDPAAPAAHDPVQLLPAGFEPSDATVTEAERSSSSEPVVLAPDAIVMPDAALPLDPALAAPIAAAVVAPQAQPQSVEAAPGQPLVGGPAATASPAGPDTTRSLAAGRAEEAQAASGQAPTMAAQTVEPAPKAGGKTAQVAVGTAQADAVDDAAVDMKRPPVTHANFADTQIPVADATLRTVYQAQQSAGAALAAATPVVQAHGGQIGRDIGALIKRQIVSGREEVIVRLDPPELGRIHIRLTFEAAGELRAVVATETSAALDLLRRDIGQLDRALAEAGVRTDGQSFRFDDRQTGNGQPGRSDDGRNAPRRGSGHDAEDAIPAQPIWRGISASGRVDMIA